MLLPHIECCSVALKSTGLRSGGTFQTKLDLTISLKTLIVVKLHKSKPESLKVRVLRGAVLAPLHIITACICGLLGQFSSYQKEAFIILASISFFYPFFLPMNTLHCCHKDVYRFKVYKGHHSATLQICNNHSPFRDIGRIREQCNKKLQSAAAR